MAVFKVTQLGHFTNLMYVMPETVVSWLAQVQNIVDVNNINELFVRFGMVKQYYEVVQCRKEDEKVIGYGISELGSQVPESSQKANQTQCIYCAEKFKCLDKSNCTKNCAKFEDYFEGLQVPQELFKCFFLTFYDDLAEKYLPKKNGEIKHLPISNGDRFQLKQAGSRMFGAASVIFATKFPELSANLKILAQMCEAGTLQKELIDLCKLEKIGFARAKKLAEKGITTKGAFLSTPAKELGLILGLSERVAQNMIEINSTQ